MSDPVLVSYLVSQTQANIDFLQSQGYLTLEDAVNIRSKLVAVTTFKKSDKSSNTPAPVPLPQDHSSTHQPPPSQPASNCSKAKALWAYNEDGKVCHPENSGPPNSATHIRHKEPNDLTMSVGDVIDIIEENNADWWTGRNRGKQGLFPSTYVQKLLPESMPQSYQEKVHGAPGYTNYGNHYPPQQISPVNNVIPVDSVGLPPGGGQDKKNNKFGKYGNTVRPILVPS